MSRLVRVIAASIGMTAFAVAALASLSAGHTFERSVAAALAAMVACHLVGAALGTIAERVVNTHVEAYKAAREAEMSAAVSATGAQVTATGEG